MINTSDYIIIYMKTVVEGNELKCLKCDSEWSPPRKISSMFCPFCRAPLFEVTERFNDLDRVLCYLTSRFGDEILNNKQDVLRFLEVYFPEGKREFNFINIIYASGLMGTLFRLQGVPHIIQKNSIKQIQNQLCQKYGISEKWGEYVIGCVCHSLGLTNNIENSFVKVKQAAELGDPTAQITLAKWYHMGHNVKKDQAQYFLWLQKSADSGNAEAMFLLGKEFYTGSCRDKNLEKATTLLKSAALKKNSSAICLISSEASLQRICDIDIEKCVAELLKDTNALSSEEFLQLSKYYADKSTELSLDLARCSYEKDPKYAWEYYANLLLASSDHEKELLALRVVREIATEGNTVAIKMLAKRSDRLAKTEKDMLTAVFYYRLAAESGDVDSQLRLAEIFETGYLVKKSIENAVYWYKVASVNGSQRAREKVSYKSPKCIITKLTLLLEDDTELECIVKGIVTFRNEDYLILEDPDTKELFTVKYIEDSSIEGYLIENVDESIERIILSKFGG